MNTLQHDCMIFVKALASMPDEDASQFSSSSKMVGMVQERNKFKEECKTLLAKHNTSVEIIPIPKEEDL